LLLSISAIAHVNRRIAIPTAECKRIIHLLRGNGILNARHFSAGASLSDEASSKQVSPLASRRQGGIFGGGR